MLPSNVRSKLALDEDFEEQDEEDEQDEEVEQEEEVEGEEGLYAPLVFEQYG